MSDDSTKPAEVTPEAAAAVKPEEPAVKVSPEEAQAWLEKSERFVTIGGVALVAFHSMSAGKVAEVFEVRELPKRTLEAVPDRQAIKELR